VNRDAARDRLVEGLAAAQARLDERFVQDEAAKLALREHGEGVVESSARALTAAQARFAVDPAALRDWAMAVDQRARALVARAAALERRLVAAFDRSEALGFEPDPSDATEGPR
jgi:hypothetical protein